MKASSAKFVKPVIELTFHNNRSVNIDDSYSLILQVLSCHIVTLVEMYIFHSPTDLLSYGAIFFRGQGHLGVLAWKFTGSAWKKDTKHD
jgi:hypothetical protein